MANRRERQVASRRALNRRVVSKIRPLRSIRRRSAHGHRHAIGHGLDRDDCRANTCFGRGSILNGGDGESILRIGLQPIPLERGLRVVGNLPAIDDRIRRIALQHAHAVAKATLVCEYIVPAKRNAGRIDGVCRKARHGRRVGHLDVLNVIAHDPELVGVLGAELVARVCLELVDIHRVDAQTPHKTVLALRGLGQVVDGAAVFGRFTRGVTRSKAGVGTKAQAAKQLVLCELRAHDNAAVQRQAELELLLLALLDFDGLLNARPRLRGGAVKPIVRVGARYARLAQAKGIPNGSLAVERRLIGSGFSRPVGQKVAERRHIVLFGNAVIGLDINDRGLRAERHGRRHHALATSFLIFDLILVIDHRNRVEHGLVTLAGMRLIAYACADRALAPVVIASLGGKID